jgi:acyl carrier protein
MPLSEQAVFDFLHDSLGVDTSDLDRDSLLFSSGVIDSFTLVSLLTFVESSCHFRIDPMDVNLDNFDSVGRILDYVGRVQSNA